MPTAAVAAIGAAGSIGGSLIGASASGKAAAAQVDASKAANAMQWNMYQQNREDTAPWRNAGIWSLDRLKPLIEAGPGDYRKSPGYDFRLTEGLNAMNRAAAAGGKLGSGGQLKAAIQYGQDYATGDYQNFLNRYYQSLTPYQSLAGLGQTSADLLTQEGTATANAMGRNAMYGGTARASGYINAANAMSGGISSGINNMMFYNLINGNSGGSMNPLNMMGNGGYTGPAAGSSTPDWFTPANYGYGGGTP